MKNLITSILLLTLVIQSQFRTYADSPITSTGFSSAYMDYEMVLKAKNMGEINAEIANFLMSSKNEIDVKAAVINAMSWKFDGKKNAEVFKEYIEKKHNKSFKKIKEKKFKNDELFCLGYMTVLDDYFNPKPAIPILEKALAANPNSYTVNIILALTKAQKAFDKDWCEVWKVCEKVFNNKDLKQDMRQGAVKIIRDYMELYSDECKDEH